LSGQGGEGEAGRKIRWRKKLRKVARGKENEGKKGGFFFLKKKTFSNRQKKTPKKQSQPRRSREKNKGRGRHNEIRGRPNAIGWGYPPGNTVFPPEPGVLDGGENPEKGPGGKSRKKIQLENKEKN